MYTPSPAISSSPIESKLSSVYRGFVFTRCYLDLKSSSASHPLPFNSISLTIISLIGAQSDPTVLIPITTASMHTTRIMKHHIASFLLRNQSLALTLPLLSPLILILLRSHQTPTQPPPQTPREYSPKPSNHDELTSKTLTLSFILIPLSPHNLPTFPLAPSHPTELTKINPSTHPKAQNRQSGPKPSKKIPPLPRKDLIIKHNTSRPFPTRNSMPYSSITRCSNTSFLATHDVMYQSCGEAGWRDEWNLDTRA